MKRRVDDLSQKGSPDASVVSHLQVPPVYHQGMHKRDPSIDERILQDGKESGLLGLFLDILAEVRHYHHTEKESVDLYPRFIRNMVPKSPDTPIPRSFKDIWGEGVRLWIARGVVEEIAAVVCPEGIVRLFTRMSASPDVPQEESGGGREDKSWQRRTDAGYVAADGPFSQSLKQYRGRRFIGPPLR